MIVDLNLHINILYYLLFVHKFVHMKLLVLLELMIQLIVLINYLENKLNGEYLDFSYERNSMIISKKVVFTNIENILEADVIEINIKTKDTKIFMHENEKKVNIKSKNLNGNN